MRALRTDTQQVGDDRSDEQETSGGGRGGAAWQTLCRR